MAISWPFRPISAKFTTFLCDLYMFTGNSQEDGTFQMPAETTLVAGSTGCHGFETVAGGLRQGVGPRAVGQEDGVLETKRRKTSKNRRKASRVNTQALSTDVPESGR